MTQIATSPVAIIARIEIKKNGIVVYKVRSSNGVDVYNVTVTRGKVNSCSCPSYKPCKHMAAVAMKEQERQHQEEAERRAAYIQMFDPCNLGW